MVNTAEQTAHNAESIDHNDVGFCLQWCRERADIPALHGTAALAAANATDMHHDRDIPRGGFAYWTGGSEGSGHIVIGLGDGLVRSTDADGPGNVATRPIDWFDDNFPDLTYVGWADNVNGVTVPGVGDDMPLSPEDKLWILGALDARLEAFGKNAGELIKLDNDDDKRSPKWSLERVLRSLR